MHKICWWRVADGRLAPIRGAECTSWIQPEDDHMAESVYKVIELVGTRLESWEKVAGAAVRRASQTLHNRTGRK